MIFDCFHTLDIAPTKDTREIKRAYARFLKINRPDENAESFQLLNEAYERCLKYANSYDELITHPFMSNSDDFESSTRHEPSYTINSSEQTVEINSTLAEIKDQFDLTDFFTNLSINLTQLLPESFLSWLQNHPALYSLDHKASLRFEIVNWLLTFNESPIQQNLNLLMSFFSLDNIGVDGDPISQKIYMIHQRFDEKDRFDRIIRLKSGNYSTWHDRLMLRELRDPFSSLRRMCFIFVIGQPWLIYKLWLELNAVSPESTLNTLNTKSVHFWRMSTDRNKISKERFGLVLGRVLLLTIVLIYSHFFIPEAPEIAFRNPIIFIAKAMSIWGVYACSVMVWLKLQQFIRYKMNWDSTTFNTSLAVTICFVIINFYPYLGAFLFVLLGWLWLQTRFGGRSHQFITCLNGLTLFIFSSGATEYLFGSDIPMRLNYGIAALYTFIILILHDVIYAKQYKISLTLARTTIGMLWGIFSFHIIVLWFFYISQSSA